MDITYGLLINANYLNKYYNNFRSFQTGIVKEVMFNIVK